MNNNNKNYRKAKNSKPSVQVDKKFIDLLKSARESGATVFYVFKTQRIRFTEQFPKGQYYTTKSVLSTPLNEAIFYITKGEFRGPQIVKDILKDTCHDLGASTFYIQ